MKRQGSHMENMGYEDHPKKRKRDVETKEEGGEAAAAALCWEEWQWLRGAEESDEQMPWASVWSPLWDMDYVDRAYGALFWDVAWDDDIWDLKTVTVIPRNQTKEPGRRTDNVLVSNLVLEYANNLD